MKIEIIDVGPDNLNQIMEDMYLHLEKHFNTITDRNDTWADLLTVHIFRFVSGFPPVTLVMDEFEQAMMLVLLLGCAINNDPDGLDKLRDGLKRKYGTRIVELDIQKPDLESDVSMN